jgi:type IV pilus assembly protein PilY1
MDELIQALLLIFNEVQAVNSVFASASLPISVNAQGTFLNQIYMGMFRPDAQGLPRWAGNLKQYQFGIDDTDKQNVQLFMADSTGAKAISRAGTGFISPNAISFWTKIDKTTLPDNIDPTGSSGTSGGFWINKPQGVSNGFDSSDGEVVEKGGVGQQIRLANLQKGYTGSPGTSDNPRTLYTCTGTCAAGSSLSATPFDITNNDVTDAALGTTLPGVQISSLTRNSTTATATLVSPGMSPALTAGQSVTVAGSAYPEFNGNFSAGSPTATSFTYTITTSPPSTATGTGYTATVPSSPLHITSLSRSGTTVTANVPGHNFAAGQSVTISGASGSEYNGTFTVATSSPPNSFTYTISDGPTAPGGGGTARVGAGALMTIQPSNANGIQRVAGSTTVTVTLSSKHSYSTGNTVTIANAAPTQYNGSWTITALGNKCPGGTQNFSFCFNIGSTTPATPDVTVGMKADAVASVASITSLTRTTSTCTGGTPSRQATVTATTSANHNFAPGQMVTIGATSLGPNETAYTGTYQLVTASGTTFTYKIDTSPACSESGNSSLTASTFGVDRASLIKWVRGKDSFGDEPSPGSGITIRPSIHGDVLHSRPAVIDYPNKGVVVFYGSNDGTFRAINGNKTGNIDGVAPGNELWSFIPEEFFTKLQRLYFNSPIVKLPSTPDGITPTPIAKDYFFDGSTGVYQNVADSKAYIFLTARRGGAVIYGLDVSDPSTPKLLWKHTNADTGFSELGETWSQPRVALIKGYSTTKPVIIFGAGYDSAEDAEPQPDAASRTKGRGIFILDAETGNIVWQAGPGGSSQSCTMGASVCQLQDMTYAIPSDVTLVDRNFDGYIDRLYVPDLGGNIWRVDLEPGPTSSDNTPDKWLATHFASLGGSGSTKRKMFFPPDFVPTKNFDAIMVPTGDREHPLYVDPTLPANSNATIQIINRFYMLKDLRTGMNACDPGCLPVITDSTSSTADDKPANLFNATPKLPATLPSSTPSTPADTYDGSGDGFYITLRNLKVHTDNSTDPPTISYGPELEYGEKAVNAPTTIGGNTFFGTNTPLAPDSSVCQANLGTARGYSVNIVTGASKFVEFAGGGLPPSPVAGVFQDDNGKKYLFCIGCGNPDPTCTGPDCTSPLGGIKPPIPITPVRSRVYWYRDHDK